MNVILSPTSQNHIEFSTSMALAAYGHASGRSNMHNENSTVRVHKNGIRRSESELALANNKHHQLN